MIYLENGWNAEITAEAFQVVYVLQLRIFLKQSFTKSLHSLDLGWSTLVEKLVLSALTGMKNLWPQNKVAGLSRPLKNVDLNNVCKGTFDTALWVWDAIPELEQNNVTELKGENINNSKHSKWFV